MNKNVRTAALAIPFAFFPPPAANAADTGDLWEVSSAMNIPGMPAGMGSRTSRVCRDKNQSPGPGRNDCKVSDLKRSGLTETMTVTCPDGTMKVEMTYNAARTEFKGVMSMTSKQGDMTINTNGRRVGACDPQVAQREGQEKADKMRAQGAAASAQANQMIAKTKQEALANAKKSCSEGVTKMEPRGIAGPLCIVDRNNPNAALMMATPHCSPNATPEAREFYMPAEAQTFCEAKRTEFCQRLQTEAGYQKASGTALKESNLESLVRTGRRNSPEDPDEDRGTNERAAKDRAGNLTEASHLCSLQPAKLTAGVCASAKKAESLAFLNTFCPADYKQVVAAKCARAVTEEQLEFIGTTCPAEGKQLGAAKCPQALKTEAYTYLARYCPADAKPLFAKNCAGRTYTSVYAKNPKMLRMCAAIETTQQEMVDEGARQPAAAQKKPSATEAATKGVTEGVNQGINKIKGLFGR